MIHENLVKKTTTLKTLDRIKGSEGHEDYFVLHEDRVRYCIKLDFATNYMGQPTGFFVRIRIVPSAKIDLYNMRNWFKTNFTVGELEKKLSTKFIKGQSLTLGEERISFVLISEKALSDYGDPTTQEGYDTLMGILTKDFDRLGDRILRSIGMFCKTNDKVKSLIGEVMKDYMTMYAPESPTKGKAKKKKATVTAIGAKTGGKEKIIEDILFVDEETGVTTSVKGTEMGDAALEILNEVVEPPKKDKPKKK